MGFSIKEVQYATICRIIEESRDQAERFPYEDILRHAGVSLVPGCSQLGIPITAQFGGFLEEPVPDELAEQLRGQIYQPGMEVQYKGETCVVVFISLLPGEKFRIDSFDPDYDSVERYKIEPGRRIPPDCSIQMLRLAPADWIFSAN